MAVASLCSVEKRGDLAPLLVSSSTIVTQVGWDWSAAGHVTSALTVIGHQDAGSRDAQLDQASSCSDSDVIFDV